MSNLKQISKAGVIVVIVFLVFIFMVVIPLLNQMKFIARNTICSWNLGGIGNSLNAYAFGYRDEYPVQGAGTHVWGTTTTGWNNPKKNWKQSTGTMTVASSLFLLIRENDIGVKSFMCVSSDQQPFVNDTDFDNVELWDFGSNPTDHLSYSYQFPYGKFPAGGTSNPSVAIMADRNPWFDKKLTPSAIENERRGTFADKVSLIDIFKDARNWKTRIGNSQPHGRRGQNVLFNDGHVSFVKRCDVGKFDDNIYTIGGQTQEEKRRGIAPVSDVIDAVDEFDSLLVNDRSR